MELTGLYSFFHPLPDRARTLASPPRFTFPFYYQPHPLAVAAAEDLQTKLKTPQKWKHDFGAEVSGTGRRGKMFGVLVVSSPTGERGYLAAYSGKLANSNHLPGFVPPVFDLLHQGGFYRVGEEKINRITLRITGLEQAPELQELRRALRQLQLEKEEALRKEKAVSKTARKARRIRRAGAMQELSPAEYAELDRKLSEESIAFSYALKDLNRTWKLRIEQAEAALRVRTDEINRLRELRASLSNQLQQRIFANYRFLNARGKERDLGDIFRDTAFGIPPAGAGECAAPKLLQFAYRNGLRPLALAEFWWGQSPPSEIRHHANFYPACRGKCEPILGHMLKGLPVDPNPLIVNPAAGKKMEIIFEDDAMLVINKPAGFLSVPGKIINDSVWLRIQQNYPEATGPLIVHRLDMSTSGLMLVAKTKEAHKSLQQQFIHRTVNKRYIALVEGLVERNSGTINLPLRGDVTDRPRQIVCRQGGKAAVTRWKIAEWRGNRSLIHFWPATGRTHQLRVHAAHPEGLGAPIVGDDLYGKRAERLYLHAEKITFRHPVSEKEVILTAPNPF